MLDKVLNFMVPILITCWKRPDKVKILIDSIRSFAPKKVYVSCDGPNLKIVGNKEKVEETKRVLLEKINWDCELFTLFNKKNNGCRLAMTKAINWFFDHETEGIILEDDCIPSYEFYFFCSELLNRYRNNSDIWTISGNNFQKGNWRGEGKYYFSKYFHCWGWATWRDRWIKFDSDLVKWKNSNKNVLISKLFKSKREQTYWKDIFEKLALENKPDSWAYRWAFTCFFNNGFSIIPNKNLVQNIGFDNEGTNTSYNRTKTSIDNGLLPLIHPNNIEIDELADQYTFVNHFYNKSLLFKFKKLIDYPLYYPSRILKFLIKKFE